MKRLIFLGILLSIFTALLFGSNSVSDLSNQKLILENMSLNPLAFTENQGQWDEKVKFKADAGGANMWFTEEGVCYQFVRRISEDEPDQDDPFLLPHERFEQEPDSFEQLVLKASFVGANLNPAVSGENMMEYKCNYFIGNDPNEWHTNVSNYQAVYIEEIYPGIDLKYYGNGKQMEYDFIVSPGTDYTQIQIQYEGAKSLSVNSSGELVVETEWGNVTEQKPIVYQLNGGHRQELEGDYHITDNNTFSFKLADNYNPNLPVVIDPVLVYSTYLGGIDDDYGEAICVDDGGCAYIAGYTSLAFPARMVYDNGDGRILGGFVAKFSSDGSSMIYSTYLGGESVLCRGICVDADGSAYVTGATGAGFPTVNAYDSSYHGAGDAFIAKLSPAGDSLIYSTYLGGADGETGYDISIDNMNNVYITGQTVSLDFPTENPYDDSHSGVFGDVFATKLSAAGNTLIYSTYLGGAENEWGSGICVDGNGNAYIAGNTKSPDFPTENPFDDSYDGGYYDIFLTKLSGAGNSLEYSTYLGGESGDYCEEVCVDGSGSAYVTGFTGSSDFPMENPYDSTRRSSDAFITKFTPAGNSLVYSTFLGGSNDEWGYGICVDQNDCAYVTGWTASPDFPTRIAYNSNFGGDYDVYVTKFSSAGNTLVYSTYLGGTGEEQGHSICVDDSGSVYVTGFTESSDFPTENAYDDSYDSGRDVFIAKLPPIDYLCGDANGDGIVNVSDAVYIINYVFVGGNPPNPMAAGDANCDGTCNVSDAVMIINYVFAGGNEPCDIDPPSPNGDGIPEC